MPHKRNFFLIALELPPLWVLVGVSLQLAHLNKLYLCFSTLSLGRPLPTNTLLYISTNMTLY